MPQLTFTRFIAAIFIVIFHFGRNIAPFNNSTISQWVGMAPAGVSYFFLLSGFILTFAYDNETKKPINKKQYYLSRLARIYPIYILALAVLTVFLLLTKQTVSIKALFLQATLFQAWFPNYAATLNIPSWSLSVEAFFYLLFPVLLASLKRVTKAWLLLMTGLLFWLISLFIYYYGINNFPSTSGLYHHLLNYNPLLHLNSFVLGIVACLLFKRINKPISGAWSISLMLIPMAFIMALIIKHAPILHYNNNGLLAPLLAIFLTGLASDRTKLSKFLSLRPFVLLGEISYSIYILQVPIHAWWDGTLNLWLISYPLLNFFGFFILLIIISWLSFEFIEKPIRGYIKKYNNKTI